MNHMIIPISEAEIITNTLPYDTTLWRYLTRDKVEHLMAEQGFWFSRIDTFIGDPSEGTRPISSDLSCSEQRFFDDYCINGWGEQYPGATDEQKTHYFALCWHINHKENSRMWREYTGDCYDSVAIVTSHKAMQRWISEANRQLWAAPVKYCADDTPRPSWRYEDLFFYKDRQKFGHEKEFRILTAWSHDELPSPPHDTLVSKRRIVPFNCRRDIHKIVFHPKASAAFKKDFRAIARKSFPRLRDVEDSSLVPLHWQEK